MPINVHGAAAETLLVVEPRDAVRRSLRRVLRADRRVFAVEDACSAYRLLRYGRFDGVVVSSYGGSGEARDIRSWLARHGLPIPVLGLVGLRDEPESAAPHRPASPNEANGVLSCLVVWPAVDQGVCPPAARRRAHASEREAQM